MREREDVEFTNRTRPDRVDLPPVVLLCDPAVPHLPTDVGAELAGLLGHVVLAVEHLDVFGSSEHRASGLNDVAEAVGRVRDVAGVPSDVEIEAVPPRSPAQDYFRVRTAPVDATVALSCMAEVLRFTVWDLVDAPVSGSDLEREIRAFRQVVIDLGAARPTIPTNDNRPREGARSHRSDVERWMWRWLVAHQFHAILNTYAAFAVRSAVSAVSAGDLDVAAGHLDRATTLVAGFAATRAHALAVPADFYQTVLRPTMTPPLTSAPLSGRMHLEYAAYRAQVRALLEIEPASLADLAMSAPSFAFAREALLEADLIDAERHVTLVEPMVGASKSIVQTAKSPDNAVSALRVERHRRAKTIRAFVRHSDPLGEEQRR